MVRFASGVFAMPGPKDCGGSTNYQFISLNLKILT